MTADIDIEVLLLHDRLRRALRGGVYDPLAGIGACGERKAVIAPGGRQEFVPVAMTRDSAYTAACRDRTAWARLRCRYDFEYWAAYAVVVKDKMSPRDIPFVLNGPQRRVLEVLEDDRTHGRPIRLIMLKARQWGGSTLVQMYMAWIQMCHRTNWHSLICAHVRDAAAGIRGMYSKMLANYPAELCDEGTAPAFKPFESSSNTRLIAGRDCRVTIGSAERPDSIRGSDIAMAHLSEAAYWPATHTRSPKTLVQAVCGGVALVPYSLVVIESTARGVGDFFHTEWLRARSGRSDKHAVFVPWYEIDFYRLECPDRRALLESLDDYERRLWQCGCDTDSIYWFRRKSLEFETRQQFSAEYPGDDTEAFADSKEAVFATSKVEALRAGCVAAARRGEVDSEGRVFTDDERGRMLMWHAPQAGHQYVVAVDVGGRSYSADWSVIAVLDADPVQPRVVAQWRGHIDHDLLARKSAAIARFYNTALLVIESNTYETAEYGGADTNLFILARMAEVYPNMYMRESYDTVTQTRTTRVGFHTNRATKAMLIAGLIEAVREDAYIEADPEACNELLTYRTLPNGGYAAADGHHDDILMTRAIALHVIRSGQLSPALPTDYTLKNWW